MKRVALRVGLFALAGLALLALGLIAAGGGWVGGSTDRVLMRFDRSVYGLQVGAPVMLRGVRVGQVASIGLGTALAGVPDVPVHADFDHDRLLELVGRGAGRDPLAALLARGLVAQLATQSLLTGLLYVDLDINPARAARARRAHPEVGARDIPTVANRLQTLQEQLDGLDIARIGQDLSAAVAAANALLSGPDAKRLLGGSADAAQALQRAAAQVQTLAARLDQQLPPLAASARGTLAEASSAARQLGAGAAGVAAAASQVQALAATSAPQVAQTLAQARQDVARAADEFARTAQALRQATADDSTLRQSAERALNDTARAARALRELGEQLDRQPDAVLRGRRGDE